MIVSQSVEIWSYWMVNVRMGTHSLEMVAAVNVNNKTITSVVIIMAYRNAAPLEKY